MPGAAIVVALVVVPVSQPVEELAMDLALVWLPVVVLVEGLLVVLALQPVVELVVDPSQVWSPVAVLVVMLVVALVLQHVEKLVESGLVLVRLQLVVDLVPVWLPVVELVVDVALVLVCAAAEVRPAAPAGPREELFGQPSSPSVGGGHVSVRAHQKALTKRLKQSFQDLEGSFACPFPSCERLPSASLPVFLE